MATRAQRIRKAVVGLGRSDQGRRVPEGLRRRVAAYARDRLAEGATLERVAMETGVSWTSVSRWVAQYREGAAPSFAPVEIVEADSTPKATRLVVRGPAGLVIEGLDVTSLAELVQRLA